MASSSAPDLLEPTSAKLHAADKDTVRALCKDMKFFQQVCVCVLLCVCGSPLVNVECVLLGVSFFIN